MAEECCVLHDGVSDCARRGTECSAHIYKVILVVSIMWQRPLTHVLTLNHVCVCMQEVSDKSRQIGKAVLLDEIEALNGQEDGATLQVCYMYV
jgi:hypothetical protein